MKLHLMKYCLLGLLVISAAFAIGAGDSKKLVIVSLIQLIANPEKYHNKHISVRGFYHREFESSGLYVSRDDAKYFVMENGVWVGNIATDAETNRIDSVNDTYVIIEGTFKHTPNGGG